MRNIELGDDFLPLKPKTLATTMTKRTQTRHH